MEWDGITRGDGYKPEFARMRHKLADAARDYKWSLVLRYLKEWPWMINGFRPGGRAWYTPLHQAAHGGAPVKVAQELIELGAWRTLRTRDGETAVDIARRQSQRGLINILTPTYEIRLRDAERRAMQKNLHQVIHEVTAEYDDLARKQELRLPELEVLLETGEEFWFPVPGMYGGFCYGLDPDRDHHVLVVESWSRVVGGSGQRHEVTADGYELTDRGFV